MCAKFKQGRKVWLRQIGKPRARCGPAGEEGAILLLVLWVLALLTVMILSWAQEWRMELKLAGNFRDANQCHRLAEAGVHYAVAKLIAAKSAETLARSMQDRAPLPPDVWQGNQSRHIVELPGGKAEVTVADEGGKIDLNLAPDKVLASLFEVLGFPEAKWRVMVDSILDWRTKGDRPRPFGARSDYYLRLDPPYPAKGARFDTVEELSWVRGFIGGAPGAMAPFLTTQELGLRINVNTAPKEVLLALGLMPEQVRAVMEARQAKVLYQLGDVPQLSVDPRMMPMIQNLAFISSPFFTILATGMINNKEGPRHTIKAIVRLDHADPTNWNFLYWADDYPI